MALPSDRRWSLTGKALDLLLARLASEPAAAAREYDRLRHRLLDFFDWQGASAPEALADETLDRIARKLEAGEEVGNVSAYGYGVARRVWLEAEKRRAQEAAAVDALGRLNAPGQAQALDTVEVRVGCLERCLKELPEESRELIVSYYQGLGRSHLEGRRLLAQRLGISYTNLKTRAHRIRIRLLECLQTCTEGKLAVTNGRPEPQSLRGAGRGASRP